MQPSRSSLFLLVAITYCLTSAAPTYAEVHLILGGEDEEESLLLMPSQVAEGPDGNLYVFDAGDSLIKVFTPTGEHLRDLAGSGEGPGEIQRADGATFGFTPEGLLYFTEFFRGHRWLTLLQLDGTLVNTISPQLQVAFGVQGAVPLPDGRFLVQIAYGTKAEAEGDIYLYRMPQTLTVMDDQGVLGPEILRTDHIRLISTSPNGGDTTLPYLPSFTWVCAPTGRIVWSDGLSPQLRVFDLEGRALDPLVTPLPPAGEVTRDDLKRWQKSREEMMMDLDPAWWQRFGRAVNSYDKALYPRPVISNLDVTPAGNLLVLVTGRPGPDEKTVPYWLLDSEGKLIQQCRAPVRQLGVSEHFLLFFTEHEDGHQLVHALVREQDEAAALAQLEVFLAGSE